VTPDEELVHLLEMVWSSLGSLGDELSEPEWKRPTEVPGWSVQDNLAHITGIEASLLGRAAPKHEIAGDLAHVKNDIGTSNEVFVDSRRARTGAEVLAEFREVTGERLAALRTCTPEEFAAETWTPVGKGAVRDLLPFRIFDSWVHEQDMRRAVQRPGDLDSPVAEAAFERIAGTMPYVVGKKAGAPDSSTIVFDLAPPLAKTLAIGVEGGRAKRLDAPPASPTVRISTDTETFCRLATGRMDAADALNDGRLQFEGDDAIGQRVVEQLNFLF
jgi:uncharacterized protein (TIGR03083 family)